MEDYDFKTLVLIAVAQIVLIWAGVAILIGLISDACGATPTS